jgi:hypothetical protein
MRKGKDMDPLTYESGSGRPKNKRILRIRIPNTGNKDRKPIRDLNGSTLCSQKYITNKNAAAYSLDQSYSNNVQRVTMFLLKHAANINGIQGLPNGPKKINQASERMNKGSVELSRAREQANKQTRKPNK